MYEVKEMIFRVGGLINRRNLIRYQVVSERGLYAELDNRNDAEIVAYGLNHGFQESYLGGFAESEAEKIKAAMSQQ